MSIREILDGLTKKSTRNQAPRSSAPRARLQLEALEMRMVLSGVTGNPIINPITGTLSSSSQSGQ